MKNKDFMREIVAGRVSAPTTRNRSGYKECFNVLYDGEHVYSYGGHYPLLIQLETENGPRWILNDRGYSSSTGRHISHARGLEDAAVQMPRGGSTYAEDIKAAAAAEIVEQLAHIEACREKIAKRPHHARVYEQSIERTEDRMQNLHRVISICDDAQAYAAANRADRAA